MKKDIMLKINGEYLKEVLISSEYGGLVDIVVDNENIGNIVVSREKGQPMLNIEIFVIKQGLRAMGYGTKVMNLLKSQAKSIGFESITGTCSDELVSFYRNLGAYFEDKLKPGYPYISNKFYIEL